MISVQDSAAVYDVPPLKESFPAASHLALFPVVGRQNWTRLESKTPREIVNMNRKTTLKLAVLTACQDCKKSIRLVMQTSKVLSTKSHEYTCTYLF